MISLRLRLLAVVAAAVSPFIVDAFLSAQRERVAAGEVLAEQTLQRARAAADRLDAQFTVVDWLLDSALVIARRPMRRSPSMALPRDSSRIGVNPLTPTIGALGITGAVVGTVAGRRSLLEQLSAGRRAKLASSAAGPFADNGSAPSSTLVDEGEVRAAGDSVAMIVARTVPHSGGKCQCLADSAVTMVALLTDNDVASIVDAASLPDGAVATLIGSRGAQVGRLPGRDRWIADISTEEQLRTTAVERQGTLDLRGVDGVDRSVGFAAISKLPWRVYVGVPAAAAVAGIGRNTELVLLVALALVIAVIGVELVLRNSVTRPVARDMPAARSATAARAVVPVENAATEAPPAVIMSEEELLEFGDDIERLVELSLAPATATLEPAGTERP